jgi:hypothetical protein
MRTWRCVALPKTQYDANLNQNLNIDGHPPDDFIEELYSRPDDSRRRAFFFGILQDNFAYTPQLFVSEQAN